MKKAIKDHARDFVYIIGLLILSLAVAGFILTKQRLRFPLIQPPTIKMYAEVPTSQGFTPGQGQTVRVSGVQVGEVGSATYSNGRALLELDIDPQYNHLIHKDASVLIRPRTGLQDLFLELQPGSPNQKVEGQGFTIPVSQTLPEVNTDEILAGLDSDTRAYLNLLINSGGQGLRPNGGHEIAQILSKFLPTHRDLGRVSHAVAARGHNLRRLINSLQRLNTALATKQQQIVQLVDSSSTVFRAFASEDTNISRAVADLPATLRQTTVTLGKVQTFANLLGPTANNLLPAARDLPSANAALIRLATPGTPIVRDQIRPFVRAARPLVRNLRPAAINLNKSTPHLISTFKVLNHLFNMLGYNPGDGPSAPQHGYLWWLAWGDHEARTLFSVQDPNGSFRPLYAQISCATVANSLGTVGGALTVNLLQIPTVQSICRTLGFGTSKDQKQHSAAAAADAAKMHEQEAANAQKLSAAGSSSSSSSAPSSAGGKP